MNIATDGTGNMKFEPTGHNCVVVIVMRDGRTVVVEEVNRQIYFDAPWLMQITDKPQHKESL